MEPEQATRPLLAVGTYTLRMPHVDGRGEGVHLLQLDPANGALQQVGLARGAVNPSYLTVSADRKRLYAVREVGAESGPGLVTFALDATNFSLVPLADMPTPGGWPCHVSVDARLSMVLVSNYATGEVLAYALDADGIPHGEPLVLTRTGAGPNAQRQEGPHSHCAVVSPDRRHVYLADLGTDSIARHALRDGRIYPVADLTLPASPGAGPRHVLFTPSGAAMLANYELSSTVRLYKLAGDTVELASEVSTLPGDWTGVSGAGGMRLHPSGRLVYVGNRGHDSVFGARVDEASGTLAPIGIWPLDGRTPRDVAVSPDGRYLLAASQDDAFIRVFAIDQQSGELRPTGTDYPIHSAVCLHFV
jgi:6-phosphogluconolactonase